MFILSFFALDESNGSVGLLMDMVWHHVGRIDKKLIAE